MSKRFLRNQRGGQSLQTDFERLQARLASLPRSDTVAQLRGSMTKVRPSLNRAGDASGWQPISSAPFGRPVLVYDQYFFVRIGKQFPRDAARILGFDAPGDSWVWITDLPYGEERGEVGCVLDPTHWAPIPLPFPSSP